MRFEYKNLYVNTEGYIVNDTYETDINVKYYSKGLIKKLLTQYLEKEELESLRFKWFLNKIKLFWKDANIEITEDLKYNLGDDLLFIHENILYITGKDNIINSSKLLNFISKESLELGITLEVTRRYSKDYRESVHLYINLLEKIYGRGFQYLIHRNDTYYRKHILLTKGKYVLPEVEKIKSIHELRYSVYKVQKELRVLDLESLEGNVSRLYIYMGLKEPGFKYELITSSLYDRRNYFIRLYDSLDIDISKDNKFLEHLERVFWNQYDGMNLLQLKSLTGSIEMSKIAVEHTGFVSYISYKGESNIFLKSVTGICTVDSDGFINIEDIKIGEKISKHVNDFSEEDMSALLSVITRTIGIRLGSEMQTEIVNKLKSYWRINYFIERDRTTLWDL